MSTITQMNSEQPSITPRERRHQLRTLLRETPKAAEQIFPRGTGIGPILIGYATKEVFLEMEGHFRGSYRFSWGINKKEDGGLEAADKEASLGPVLYWGDGRRQHARTSGWIQSQVANQMSSHLVISGGAGWEELEWDETLQGLTQSKCILKDPDWSYSYDGSQTETVIEVAYNNESARTLLDEVKLWSKGGFNALGIKVWSDVDDPAPLTDPSSPPCSALVVAQRGHLSLQRIWRIGRQAQEFDFPSDCHLREETDNLVVLPGRWFTPGTPFSREDKGKPIPPVILSLHNLLLTVDRQRPSHVCNTGEASEGEDLLWLINQTKANIEDIETSTSELLEASWRDELLDKEKKQLDFWHQLWADEGY